MCSILVELEFAVLAFVEGGKPKNPQKNPQSKARTNNKLNPQMHGTAPESQVTLVGGECSHHCAIPTPPKIPKT